MEDPKVDEVVYLNSGSPKLTIVEVREDVVKVAWSDREGNKQEAILPAVCLSRTRTYSLAQDLRTEEEREAFLQAMIEDGASEEEMVHARAIVEKSRQGE